MILWVIMIVVIIVCLIIIKCFSVFDNILDDASSSPEKFSNKFNDIESFSNLTTDSKYIKDNNELTGDGCCIPVIFSSPSTVSIPDNKGIAATYTDGDYKIETKEKNGKFCFPIQKLMYDGIWDRKVMNYNNGFQKNIWTLPIQPKKEGNYCTNKFINVPQKKFIADKNFLGDANSNLNIQMNCCY